MTDIRQTLQPSNFLTFLISEKQDPQSETVGLELLNLFYT